MGFAPREPIPERFAYLAGFLSGFLGGAYNTGGPPLVVYGVLRCWPPTVFRATLQGYFLLLGLFVLIGHAATGLWTRSVLTSYLTLLPSVTVALWIGNWIHARISPARFTKGIDLLLLLLGLLLVRLLKG